MALDLYDPCPCGSGKKFKWCCMPVHVEIDRALRQEAEGQHDAAMRILNEVVAAHPDNPEPLGRKAHLLYEHGQAEEAEEALQKAFDINPNYPFGWLLRGLFRSEEGEIKGALLSYRKAAEVYDPQALDQLGRVYSLITDSELKQNRPLAARAALKMSLHCQPANEELIQGMEQIFGAASRFPASAVKDHAYLSPAESTSGARREAWNRALETAKGRLSDAARAFEQLTTEDDQDAAAWYNLGLSRCWLGENRGAIDALDRYAALEPDAGKAADAIVLTGILRQGVGMDDVCDYIVHSHLYQIRNMPTIFTLLQEWQRDRRFITMQVSQEQQMMAGLVLEKKPQLTPELAASQTIGLGAYILIIGEHARLWHTVPSALNLIREEFTQRGGPDVVEVQVETAPASYNDMLAELLCFPMQAANEDDAKRRVLAHEQQYFEENWIHRPLKALGGLAPVDAAGSATLRKKLLGVIQFIQECAIFTPARDYEFDRLRRKLGLLESAGTPSAAGPDVAAMSAAELAALPVQTLEEPQLELAYQTALKLDARELAGQFARALVTKPIAAGQSRDRYAWFSHLIQLAAAEGNQDEALNFVNDGEKDDCEHNEGRRRNDYELRRAQIHAKRGEIDLAADAFERLIQRVPSELKFRGSAAEAMLTARQRDRAQRFAEEGLAKAREKNDRDSEQYFLELVDAAKR